MKIKLIEEKLFNLLDRTHRTTPKLASRADFIHPVYIGLNKKEIFNFRTNSQGSPGNYWYQTIEIKNLPALVNEVDEITPEVVKRWFDTADVNIFCNDYSYLYYSLQYIRNAERLQ